MSEVDKALTALSKLDEAETPRKSALRELVAAIAEDVHDRMRQGYTLPQIVNQLNSVREPEDQINVGTFRAYLQDVRKEMGLEPVRQHVSKSAKTTRKPRKKAAEAAPMTEASSAKDVEAGNQPKEDLRASNPVENLRNMDDL